jgi:adenylate cyclase
MKYAAVGTHVNLTGRIESYTTGGQVLISESTLQEVSPIVELGRALRIEPKGARGEMTAREMVGIGGSHGLTLRAVELGLVGLAEAIPIRYAVLEDKHVGQSVLDASFVRLSVKGAAVRSAVPVPPLSNVKIWIAGLEAGAPAHELYAKVVEGGGTEFTVRFTSLAPEVGAYLGRMIH